MKENLTLFSLFDSEVEIDTSIEKSNDMIRQRENHLNQLTAQIGIADDLRNTSASSDDIHLQQAKFLSQVEMNYPNPISEELIYSLLKDSQFLTFSNFKNSDLEKDHHVNIASVKVNLQAYVQNPYTEDADFDMPLLKEHVILAQRLSDDALDIEISRLSDCETQLGNTSENLAFFHDHKKEIMAKRQSALQATSVEEMIAALNIPYASEHCNAFVAEVYRQFALAAYHSSVTLARERGAFPLYNAVKDTLNPFIGKIRNADEKLYDEMVFFGRRNFSMLFYSHSEKKDTQNFAHLSMNDDILKSITMQESIQNWMD